MCACRPDGEGPWSLQFIIQCDTEDDIVNKWHKNKMITVTISSSLPQNNENDGNYSMLYETQGG